MSEADFVMKVCLADPKVCESTSDLRLWGLQQVVSEHLCHHGLVQKPGCPEGSITASTSDNYLIVADFE